MALVSARNQGCFCVLPLSLKLFGLHAPAGGGRRPHALLAEFGIPDWVKRANRPIFDAIFSIAILSGSNRQAEDTL
jgi:hypothetical protein